LKQLFSIGIIYKDFKNTRIIFVLMVLNVFIFKSLQIYNLTNIEKITYYYDIFHYVLSLNGINEYGFIIIMCILIILLTNFQMAYDKRTSCSVTYMVPIEKGTIMINKLLMGFSYIIISFVINTILISLTVIFDSSILKDVGIKTILQWSLRNILAYIVIYLIFMLFQALTSNNVESVILGLIVINAPKGISFFFKWVESEYLINLMGRYNFENILYFLWPINYTLCFHSEFYSLMDYFPSVLESKPVNGVYRQEYILQDYEPFWTGKILILLTIIITISLFTIYVFNNSRLEIQQKNMLIKNIFVQIIALIVLGISFIALFMQFENGVLQNFYENPIILVSIATILSVYIIISIFIARNVVRKIGFSKK